MNLLIIVSAPTIGGGEKYLASLCRGMVTRGHKVIVACSKNLSKYFIINGALVYPLNIGSKINKENSWQMIFAPFYLLFYFYVIWRIKKYFRIDIVHVQYKKEQIFASIAAKVLGLKVVWTEHGPLHNIIKNNIIYKKIYLFCASFADCIIGVSDSTKRSLLSLGIPANKTEKIYNGVMIPAISKSYRGEIKKIGVVARLIPEKGHIYLLKAFNLLIEINKELNLIIAGDGPLKSYLMEIIKNLKLENNVIFLGHISEDEVKNLLRELDILVMPSIGEGEGLPYAVLEAMSFGIPVVGCNIGGIPELITNGVTGIIVPPRDVKKLAEALAKIINSPDLAYKLGLEGRIRFEKEFSFESMITKTENIFLDLINL